MLATQIAATAGMDERHFAVRKARQQLPFAPQRAYLAWDAFLLNTQGALCDQHRVAPGEAAQVVREMAPKLLARFDDIFEGGLYVAVVARRLSDGSFALGTLVGTSKQVANLMLADDDASPSDFADLVASGATDSEIRAFVLRNCPRRHVFALNASAVLLEMIERAAGAGMLLPELTAAAWTSPTFMPERKPAR